MISPRKFWNKHAESYSKRAVPNEAIYQKKLTLTQQAFNQEMTVMEYGCGTGSTALVHAPYVKQYLAIDVSDKMIDIAKQKLADTDINNLTFEVNAIESFNQSGVKFDAILALNILHLLDKPAESIKQAYALLNPNGIYVASVPSLTGLVRVFQPLWPIGVALGLIPKVQFIAHQQWLDYLQTAGFEVETHWIPEESKRTSFIIARKPE